MKPDPPLHTHTTSSSSSSTLTWSAKSVALKTSSYIGDSRQPCPPYCLGASYACTLKESLQEEIKSENRREGRKRKTKKGSHLELTLLGSWLSFEASQQSSKCPRDKGQFEFSSAPPCTPHHRTPWAWRTDLPRRKLRSSRRALPVPLKASRAASFLFRRRGRDGRMLPGWIVLTFQVAVDVSRSKPLFFSLSLSLFLTHTLSLSLFSNRKIWKLPFFWITQNFVDENETNYESACMHAVSLGGKVSFMESCWRGEHFDCLFFKVSCQWFNLEDMHGMLFALWQLLAPLSSLKILVVQVAFFCTLFFSSFPSSSPLLPLFLGGE